MREKRPALGRGLSALIPEAPAPAAPLPADQPPTGSRLDLLRPNEERPREVMMTAGSRSWARSIGSSGIIQPILVRPLTGGSYEIVAGERGGAPHSGPVS